MSWYIVLPRRPCLETAFAAWLLMRFGERQTEFAGISRARLVYSDGKIDADWKRRNLARRRTDNVFVLSADTVEPGTVIRSVSEGADAVEATIISSPFTCQLARSVASRIGIHHIYQNPNERIESFLRYFEWTEIYHQEDQGDVSEMFQMMLEQERPLCDIIKWAFLCFTVRYAQDWKEQSLLWVDHAFSLSAVQRELSQSPGYFQESCLWWNRMTDAALAQARREAASVSNNPVLCSCRMAA